MSNVDYTPKLEYLEILVKIVDISELVGVRCGDRRSLSTCNRVSVCEGCIFYPAKEQVIVNKTM